MSDDPEARLAYGYDLGSSHSAWAIKEVDEDGCLTIDWLGEDRRLDSDAAESRLLAAVGFTETDWNAEGYFQREGAAKDESGVEFDRSGTWDYRGVLLVAKGSTSHVEWSDSMVLDLDDLRAKPTAEWDAKLAAACKALGITPIQDGGPHWLVFPFYG